MDAVGARFVLATIYPLCGAGATRACLGRRLPAIDRTFPGVSLAGIRPRRLRPDRQDSTKERFPLRLIRKIWEKIWWVSFPFFEKFGIHVLPVHYYSPLPDTRELKAKKHLFDREHPMHGVDMREGEQWRLLETTLKPYEEEYEDAGNGFFGLDERKMPFFAPFNALTLYALIRHYRPKKMIEVGSGMSTRISAAAFAANRREGKPGEFFAVEPYPSEDLRRGFDGLTQTIAKKVEEFPISEFLSLGENDILFIDSTHAVKIFGDVNYLYLSVLPQLKPGVIIHIHDIFFPRDYLPHHFFQWGIKQIWQEQYLLQAFLMFNREFRVMLCSSYLHFKGLERLKGLFAWYHPSRCPSSFWMRREANIAMASPNAARFAALTEAHLP
jgi:predicted O-methyltransferase YrrM